MKPFAFGLTGGIASGKSTVSKTFAEHGIPIVDGDQIARMIVRPGAPALKKLVDHFSPEILTPEGEMDRVKVGEMVFNNDAKRQLLDKVISPYLRTACHYHTELLFDQGYKIVCFDAPLLIEKCLQELYRPVVVVHCSIKTQIDRMRSRNGFTEMQARARLAAQASTEERIRYADFTISTDNTMEETKQLARRTLRLINAWASGLWTAEG